MIIKRGDVVLADFEPVKGSEQGKIRPCLVIQNDLGNLASPTTIVAAITSNTEKEFPFTVFVQAGDGGLQRQGLILCNHIRSISINDRICSFLAVTLATRASARLSLLSLKSLSNKEARGQRTVV